MSKILYVKASPRKIRSHSLAVTEAFIDTNLKSNPDTEVMTVDLFDTDLPPMDGLAVKAKYSLMHGKALSDQEKEAWAAVDGLIGEFQSANKYVFAVPMWNFGIPYKLKQYFDLVVQPGYTFSSTQEEGYKGLMKGKPAFVAYASGGTYAEGTPAAAMDFQRRYVDTILRFIGFDEIYSVVVAPTVQEGPEVAMSKRDAAIEKAKQLAETF